MRIHAVTPTHSRQLAAHRRDDALARAAARGCTCAAPVVYVTATEAEVRHDQGCPATTTYLQATFA